jgi:hypothetical protein
MAAQDQVPSLEATESVRELLTFLREESASARDHLRNQANEDRELLTNTIKIVALPLTAVVAVVAFLGFKSLADLKETIQQEARNETKTEITRLKTETESQIKTMQSEIRQRLDQQFQTQTLRDIVKDAAREQTQTSARPLILGEVAKQVKSRVDAEQGNIRTAVTNQTQAAVKEMAPQIDKMVKENVDSKIQTQVAPVQSQIVALRRDADLQSLINRMNADDAQAFDVIVRIRLDSLDQAEQALLKSSVKSVIEVHNTGLVLGRNFLQPHTDEQAMAMLSDSEPTTREAVLGQVGNKSEVLSLLKVVEILANDPSLNVRAAAHRIFNGRTNQKFTILDKDSTLRWWTLHRDEFVGK